jgi:hypothetical protein
VQAQQQAGTPTIWHVTVGTATAPTTQALHALAQRTDCDIRSCLNTLQFLARQQQSSRGDSHHLPGGHVAHITLKHVTELSIGVKDSSKSVFSVWDSLLHVPKQQAVQGRSGQGGSARSRLVQLYSSLQDFGEHELVSESVSQWLAGPKTPGRSPMACLWTCTECPACNPVQAMRDASAMAWAAGAVGRL